MSLSPNSQLAHYTIISKIGAGGMGEVYRARDTRLDREVAIKLLPAEVSSDPDRLKRFEQEARATSALNHPNILTVYDIGTENGSPYIVAELLEGEELRDRLDAGQIPLRKAIDYAQQIVSGLSAAHEKGIVHRDLKPENLFVTNDDRVKILDFGLAKLRSNSNDERGSEDETRKVITNPGVVMGTVGYMSPEQVRGEKSDYRSDIFSFGAMLHEMITGRRAFRRDTMAETMTAILREEPEELSASNPNINPALERIVNRCLEKKPERRFHSAHDLCFVLESLSAQSSSASSSGSGLTTQASIAAVAKTTSSKWRDRLPWIVAAISLIGLLSLLVFTLARSWGNEKPSTVTRFVVMAPEKVTTLLSPELSPDGRDLVFAGVKDGTATLWIRPLGSLTATPIPGTDGVSNPHFWSPDSRSIAFPAAGQLKRLDLSGGNPKTLCALPVGPPGNGGTWNRDGIILFSSAGKIFRVSANGGNTELVIGDDKSTDALYRYPIFLPDDHHFLYLKSGTQQGAGYSEIFVTSIDGGERTRLTQADSHALYIAAGGGNLIFARDDALVAQSFDVNSLKLSGEPYTISEKVSVNNMSRGFFSVSSNGTVVLDPMGLRFDAQVLEWFDRSGKPLGTLGDSGRYMMSISNQKLSRDGKRIAVAKVDPQTRTRDIYVIEIARNTSSRLTFDPGEDQYPIWSPDGSRIAWNSNRDGGITAIYQKLASGVGEDELLLKSDAPISPSSWSPDGRFLLYNRTDPKTGPDIWVLPTEGEQKPYVFLQTPFSESAPRFSPDGKFVAYVSQDQGRPEVFVQTFPASGNRWQISNNGGRAPAWRGDGKEIFFVSGDNKLVSAEVTTGNGFEVGIPKPLFDLVSVGALSFGYVNFAPTLDGERFLVTHQSESVASLQYVVVQNWTSEKTYPK
ncbi:MAG TPA: protein kinase [Pyrinomonadaceae bacterium]|nr:protein kinase [Pyrinomonadaceae bacterium]